MGIIDFINYRHFFEIDKYRYIFAIKTKRRFDPKTKRVVASQSSMKKIWRRISELARKPEKKNHLKFLSLSHCSRFLDFSRFSGFPGFLQFFGFSTYSETQFSILSLPVLNCANPVLSFPILSSKISRNRIQSRVSVSSKNEIGIYRGIVVVIECPLALIYLILVLRSAGDSSVANSLSNALRLEMM